MTIRTSAGTTIGISATLPTTFDDDAGTGYPSLTFTTVGEVTELPAIGSVYNLVTHNPLGERRIVKKKGSVNDGSMGISFAADEDDTGQTAVKTQSTSDNDAAFAITYPGGAIDYFTGLVMDFQVVSGGADSIKSSSVNVELTRALLNVPA
tara:strand:- start:6872 stop:7324 length:453 start_codon:yes stop_codon:yes gene_type:complete